MLSSRQLREGNYLQKDGHWLQIEVEHIEHIRDGNKHNFQPIVLTPEILEKNCGFKHEVFGDEEIDGGESHYIIGDFWLNHINEDWYISGKESDVMPFQFLHELQNIYYDFNKKELTINNL